MKVVSINHKNSKQNPAGSSAASVHDDLNRLPPVEESQAEDNQKPDNLGKVVEKE